MSTLALPVPTFRIVREGPPEVDRPAIRGPRDIIELFQAELGREEVEHVYVVLLDCGHRVRGIVQVSQGLVDQSHVHPREVFRLAIREGASAVVLVHNHPSGDPMPSKADREVTRDLERAGEILAIPFLDHVIITAGKCYSFDRGEML